MVRMASLSGAIPNNVADKTASGEPPSAQRSGGADKKTPYLAENSLTSVRDSYLQ
jgi:hypothetical protein